MCRNRAGSRKSGLETPESRLQGTPEFPLGRQEALLAASGIALGRSGKPGFLFIQNESYTDFSRTTRIKKNALRGSMTVRFKPAFTARGPLQIISKWLSLREDLTGFSGRPGRSAEPYRYS